MATLAEAVGRTTLDRVLKPGTLDAIVVGSGATGGLAAQLFTESGLQVLVLDAGVPPSPVTAWWRGVIRGTARGLAGAVLDRRARRRQPIQSRCYAWIGAPEAFVDDVDCPYVARPDRPFVWFRSRQLGGRLAIPGHGRQYYRLGPADLHPIDGLSPAWPLEPGELDPWYAAVERRIGLAGGREGNVFVPDSDLARELERTPDEVELINALVARWPHVRPILGRFGVPPPFLDHAARTGRLMVRTGAIVKRLDVDATGRISGVTWIDVQSRTEVRACAPLVFLGASALESTRLLLLSRSSRHPQGLGGASGVLGRNLMDHIRVQVTGAGPSLKSPSPGEPGRCVYLPRFDTRSSGDAAGRGFGVQVYHSPGPEGRSSFSASAYGEMLPRLENRVTLDESRRDAWGIPVLRIDCVHGEADEQRGRDQIAALEELAGTIGVELTRVDAEPAPPGSANHECGTARMGADPDSSVFDPHSECWDARGLYLTDGACFPSQGIQNPTLTMLALTARACHHAIQGGAAVHPLRDEDPRMVDAGSR
jgi:choline dehydrogenase-like flavoprotein